MPIFRDRLRGASASDDERRDGTMMMPTQETALRQAGHLYRSHDLETHGSQRFVCKSRSPERWSILLLLLGVSVAAADQGLASSEPETAIVTAIPAMREIVLIGFTRPLAELPLVAETDGRVEALPLDTGDRVDDSGLFAQLDKTFTQLDLEEVGVQQERLTSQIAFDEREVTRFRELVRQNSASASQLDALEQSLRDNKHALRALDVKRRMLEERLTRATITAPAGWSITDRQIELGQWVRAGDTVGRAADFSTLLVPFALTPEQFAVLQSTESDLELDLLDQGHGPDLQVSARIHRVNPGFDPETRKIAVDLMLSESVGQARGGLRVRLRLRLPEATGALSLPATAIASSYEESWVIREDGARLPVLRLGPDARDPDLVRVTGPALRPGDRVRLIADQ
jgi:RND family efflux transporter MFP subunit